jgi:superfamily I DNA/RNA helicase
MSIAAFEGPAGCGKTYSVVDRIRTELLANPLLSHQRVLALTYMHGARHRLDDALGNIVELRGRYDASTFDSFAWRICRRWRGRVRELSLPIPPAEDFDANCTLAATLLRFDEIRRWVATAYPIILIDEAQDLVAARLGIVDELMKSCCVVLAFDEFQCLDPANRPVAVTSWIVGKCTPLTLTGSKRTRVNDLLVAARQIRDGFPLTVDSPVFKVIDAPARSGAPPVMAAAWIGQRMLKGGTFAVLTQSSKNKYMRSIVDLLRTQAVGKNKNIGPFRIAWEGAADDRIAEISAEVRTLSTTYSLAEAEAALDQYVNLAPVAMALAALRQRRNAGGIVAFGANEVADLLDRQATLSRQHTRRRVGGRRALTVHQAKNREFDHVAVVWPYGVGGSDDDKRRLLYNAVTRAKLSCLIVVQDKKLLGFAPFV